MTQTKQQRKSLPCMETKPCQFLIRLACIFGFLAMDGMSASAQFTYDWPDHSALSEGQWVKMATVRTGFHKVDANLISSLGLDPSAVNPNQINLYGHGGDALPIDNADPRPLDLVPVPIEMVDDGDNQFDGNDHFIFMGNGPEQWNYDEVTGKWRHQLNPWSDTAWYYLRIDDTAPVRLVNAPALSGDFDTVLVETDFHLFHELEQSTIIRSGRNFFGEVFDQNPTHTIPFQVPDVVAKTAQLEVKLMGRSVGGVSPYTVSLGDSSWTITPSVTGSQSHVPQAQVGVASGIGHLRRKWCKWASPSTLKWPMRRVGWTTSVWWEHARRHVGVNPTRICARRSSGARTNRGMVHRRSPVSPAHLGRHRSTSAILHSFFSGGRPSAFQGDL